MTLVRIVSAFGRVVLVLVLGASGSYLLLYLARWEWQRAQIAGIFFLSSLVILTMTLVLRRLTAIEQRLGTATRPVGGGEALPSSLAGTEPLQPFPWLGSDESTHVFLPVLLGFGVALSLLASLTERVVSFALGDAVLIGRELSDPRFRRRTRLVAAGLTALLLVGLVGLVVAREELMTRADEPIQGTRTYLIEVEGRRVTGDPVGSVEMLTTFCIARAGVPRLVVDAVRPAGPTAAVLVVHPVLGEYDLARFDGCLNDLVLDRRTTEVVEVVTQLGGAPEVAATRR